MSLGTILVILLILALVGALPTFPYSRGWGATPASVIGVVLFIVIVLLLLGKL